MTYRELLQKEHPEAVNKKYEGGCDGCPFIYGYEAGNADTPCRQYMKHNNTVCTACWDREIPRSEPDEQSNAADGDLISRSALLSDLRDKGFLPAIVQRAIERAPAADTVEVVRCKDCWHLEKGYRCRVPLGAHYPDDKYIRKDAQRTV